MPFLSLSLCVCVCACVHSESISFEWAIREAALPPGPLIFTFDVTHAEAGQHTVTTREYVYDAKVVASEVVFEGAADVPSFK